jgi:signal transduction histidine kinase
MKAHPMVGDTLLAALIAAFDLLIYIARAAGPPGVDDPEPWYVTLPLIVGVVAPIVTRRKYPITSAYLVLAIGVVHSLLEIGMASMITSCVALYTLVVYVSRRATLLYLAVTEVVTLVQTPWQFPDQWIVTLIVVNLSMAFSWALGEFNGARRAYNAEVERRLRLLETERDQQARIAVAEERARIARELHDVVAHAVSVMVVQADGAAYAVHTQPDLAERAIKTISGTGREALTELRRLLGVLRSEQSQSERTPQPGTQSLSELAARVRAVGLPVQLDIVGNVDDLPAGVGLGIYRIVQEALTNSLKHAGHGSSAVVRVARAGDRVELSIVDNGHRATRPLVGVSGGNGLIGMRERALVFGGTLEAGPRAAGGWQVRASLPISSS